MTTILVVKDKSFVVIDRCNYKPCSLGQVAKNKQSQKTPCGMYNHTTCSHIPLAIVEIFHPLTSYRTM